MSRPFGYGGVPGGWQETQLRQVLTRRKEVGRTDLPLLSVNLPRGVVMRLDGDGRPAPAENLSTYQVVHKNDLVMNQLGKPHGALGVSPYDGIISPAYFIARIEPGAEPRFLHHLLRTRLYISEFERRGKFMPPSQFDIGWDQFRSIDVTLPALHAQRVIADFLDAETARIDALIEKKRRLVELIESRFESAVLHAATQGIRGPREQRSCRLQWIDSIPAEWGLPTVSANFDLQLGKMLNADAASGGNQYPYVRNVNVQWDRLELDDLPTMQFEAADRARCELRPGDVLVCEGGEVGRAAVWSGEMDDCFYQKAIHRARPRQAANSRFLMYSLRAAAKRSVFVVEGNLSTIVHLTGEQLRVHRFPWPPNEEQLEIVEFLDGLATQTRELTGRLRAQIELLVVRRQALITAAVTGELEIPGVAA